ncbi:thioredoxin family protein [Hippea sp. KM1]|uniref:thioredoxin family protein n=1 Tax=Hippea sp. KM1 TaxID=944481 RepID=UPI00046D6A1D|nr:thioredoxin fold domain-containing protein [Hippea sp. KM1]
MLKRFFVFLAFTILILTYACSKKPGKTINIESNNKPMVIVFDSTTCPYCIKLKKDLENNPDIKEQLKGFELYFVHINEDNYYTIQTAKGRLKLDTASLARLFGFRGSTPFIVLTDKDGKVILTIPGYIKPKTMVRVLKYITTRAYQTMSINEYLSTP